MVKDWWTALRPINLVLVCCLQALLYWQLYGEHWQELRLGNYASLLFFATFCLTGGGYLINDFFDMYSDSVNQKRKHNLSITHIITGYIVITLLGLFASVYLAWHIDRLCYVILYVVAVVVLYAYSRWLQAIPLAGNVLVALMAGLSMTVLLLSEYPFVTSIKLTDTTTYKYITYNVIGLSLFAMVTTLIREIVKDLEDLKGDKIAGLQTFPIRFGTANAHRLIWVGQVTLLIFIVVWIVAYRQANIGDISNAFLPALGIPTFLSTYFLSRLLNAKDYIRASLMYKALMGMSLGYILWL